MTEAPSVLIPTVLLRHLFGYMSASARKALSIAATMPTASALANA